MSHLYACIRVKNLPIPTSQNGWETSRKSIEERLKHGSETPDGAGRGLSSFFARLKEGRKHENIQALFAKSALPNLFTTIIRPFRLTETLAQTAGIAEMLLQSHNGVLQLPPFRRHEKSGHIKGTPLTRSLRWTYIGKRKT